MVVIRLSRTGAKKRPFYHLVAVDSRAARDSGKYIERLGYFNPIAKGGEVRLHLNDERITYWISKGAQPSDRVTSLLKESKLAQAGISVVEKKKARQAELKIKKAHAAEAIAKAEAEAEIAAKAEAEAKAKADAEAANTGADNNESE